MKIWLDDERPAPEGWTWIKDPIQALATSLRGGVSELSVDHDLAFYDHTGKEVTGYDVLNALEELAYTVGYRDIPEKISVHSANSGARKKMEQAIESIERMRNETSR